MRLKIYNMFIDGGNNFSGYSDVHIEVKISMEVLYRDYDIYLMNDEGNY